MINVTKPENSRVLKYVIMPTGNLSVYTLNPNVDVNKAFLTDGNNLDSQIVETPIPPKNYQAVLASIVVNNSAIIVDYVNYAKAVQKPNKFDVTSQRLVF
jgi:hypothetical protein